jgi:hypothetical protein
MKRKLILVGVAAAVLAIAGTGGAFAFGGADDEDASLSGPQADRAAAAALKATRGGTVTAVERDDDAAYEVEVRRAGGSTVDVDVDGNYKVVAIDTDSESSGAEADDRENGDSD